MESQLIFQEKKEIKRLRVQNSLLASYEAPVFEKITSQGRDMVVLDIGSNDGSKTVERFSSKAISCVVGLEYNPDLAKKAQKTYGDHRFSFYPFDVEGRDFAKRLQELMKEKKIKGFDIIYLSFVLMHLKDIEGLLCELRSFLNENGKLFIIEANDSTSTLSNDENNLLNEFLDILKKDKYSGNRAIGDCICERLEQCGYEDICVWHDFISAKDGEKEKKKAIFTTFFSYLPEDVMLLSEGEPHNQEYKNWVIWIDKNYKKLKNLIVQEKGDISMGIKILTCGKGGK